MFSWCITNFFLKSLRLLEEKSATPDLGRSSLREVPLRLRLRRLGHLAEWEEEEKVERRFACVIIGKGVVVEEGTRGICRECYHIRYRDVTL